MIVAPLFSTPAQTRPVCHHASLFIFLSFSMTTKCCLCKGMLGGTAHPHLNCSTFWAFTHNENNWVPKCLEFLRENATRERFWHQSCPLCFSRSQSSFSGFALAEETCGRGRLWLIPPWEFTQSMMKTLFFFLCQSTSQHTATVNSPEQKSNVNCTLPVQMMLGAYWNCQEQPF